MVYFNLKLSRVLIYVAMSSNCNNYSADKWYDNCEYKWYKLFQIESSSILLTDQVCVTQECNQQGDNCIEVITGGSAIYWKDWQKGVAPAASSASCRMLTFRWIGWIVCTNTHLAVVNWSQYGQLWPRYRPMKGDEWLRCGQGDFLTRFRQKHYIGYLDGDVGLRLAANKAMAHTPALPSQPAANLSLLVQRAQSRQPVQASPSRYSMWCFCLIRVEKSPWPHRSHSSPFTGLYLGHSWPYRLQSTY